MVPLCCIPCSFAILLLYFYCFCQVHIYFNPFPPSPGILLTGSVCMQEDREGSDDRTTTAIGCQSGHMVRSWSWRLLIISTDCQLLCWERALIDAYVQHMGIKVGPQLHDMCICTKPYKLILSSLPLCQSLPLFLPTTWTGRDTGHRVCGQVKAHKQLRVIFKQINKESDNTVLEVPWGHWLS